MTIDIEKLGAIHRLCGYTFTASTLKNFAEAYAAEVLEDKEREIAELKKDLDKWVERATDEHIKVSELQVNNNDLREALEDISNWKFGWDGDCGVTAVAQQALSKTPAQHIKDDVLIFTKDSLQEHDNEVIERCANVCESLKEQDYCVDVRQGAEAIRALKGTGHD